MNRCVGCGEIQASIAQGKQLQATIFASSEEQENVKMFCVKEELISVY